MKMKYDEEKREWTPMTRGERILEAAVEFVCAAFALAAFALSAWLWLYATPDQCSAECDRIRAEMEAMEAAE